MGPGLARQESVGQVFGWVRNRTDPFLRFKPRPLARYPDPLLTLGVSLPDVPLSDNPLNEVQLDWLIGTERTSALVAEKAMVVVFKSGSGSCLVYFRGSNLVISGIDHYMHCKVVESLRVQYIYGFCICFTLFIVLWDIPHAALLQLWACKEPPCDSIEAE
jgi:hypothetical protein